MAQKFTSFTPLEEADKAPASKFTSFTPIEEPKEAGFLETVGANLGAGIANTGLGAAAAITDYTGFKDTAKSLDAKRKAVEEWQKEHGGESFTGKVASTVGSLAPALLAAPFTEGASLIPLLTNVGAFAIPGFRDTFNAQKEAGASTAVAAEHALAEAGFMLVGGKLIQTGGKVLPKALQAGETFLPSVAKKTVGQGAAAAGEGAVFTAADIATQKAIDKANGIDTNAPWYDPAKMLETGAAFGVLRGAHMAIAPKKAPTQEKTEPTLDKTAPLATFKTFTPIEPTTTDIKAEAAKLEERLGISPEAALRMATKRATAQTQEEEKPPAPPIVAQDMAKLAAWPDTLLTETLKLQQGKATPNQPLVDAIQAEIQRRAQTQGATNVAGTEPQPSGGGAGVVSEPIAVEPAGGLETPARDGVVPAEPNAGVPAAREVPQPAPVAENTAPEVKTLNLNFPAVTEGAPESVTTPTETVKTESQEQQAPAAPVVTPPPVAPKPAGAKDVHTVAQGAEGKWDHLVNGEVVNSYDTKRQATAASLLTKAQKAGDPTNIAQRQKAFDDAMAAAGRGRPLKVIPKPEAAEGAPSETTEPAAETAAPAVETDVQNAPTETVEGQPAAGTTETVEGEKTPIVLQEAKTVRGDALTGSSTKVKLSDGSEHEINRQDTNSTMGLPGWHDVSQHAMYSYLGNTKAEAIQELIRRQEKKSTAAAGTTETVEGEQEPKTEPTREEDNNRLNQLTRAVDRAKKQLLKDENLASDDPKLLATRERLAKAKAEYEQFSPEIYARDLARTKKSIEEFDARQAEKAKEEAPVEEPKAAKKLTKDEREEMALLESSLEKYNTSVDDKEASKHADFISSVARDTSAPKAVRERAKQMLDEEVDPKDIPSKSAFSSKFTQGPADTAFSKHTNAAQAISHILRTGTNFQKALASRLRGFVQGVKFVVVEKGDALPEGLAKKSEQWSRSIAIYNRADRTIYVRGESFGNKQGINHITILHELLHAATAKKIDLATKAIREGANLDSALVQAALSLHRTMENADTALRESARKGELTEDLANLAVNGKAFSDLHEFLAYGMTDKTMQDFLLKAKGVESDTHLFNRFVDSVRRMFGMGKDSVNALSDLILATDQILSAREVGTTEETGVYSTVKPAKDEQADLDKRAEKAWGKVEKSQAGQARADAVKGAMSLKDPKTIWTRVKGQWEKLDNKARALFASAIDRDGLAAIAGGKIPAMYDIVDRLQKMSGANATMRAKAMDMAEMVLRFKQENKEAGDLLDKVIPATTIAEYDPANPNQKFRNKLLDDQFNALGEKGQRVYTELRDYYKDMQDYARDLLESHIDKLDLPDEAKEKLMAGIRLAFESSKIEPYFPLMRFGDHIFRIGERGTEGYESYRFETKAERDFAAEQYAAEQGKSLKDLTESGRISLDTDPGSTAMRTTIEGSSKLLKEIYNSIDSANLGDTNAKAKLKDDAYQAYLAAMPEGNIRKSFIHREGVTGFSTNTLATINTQGIRMASAMSKLEHANDIRNLYEVAQRQLKGNEGYTAFVKAMGDMVENDLRPPKLGMVGEIGKNALGLLTRINFWHNMTSLSSAIGQPFDIISVGAPVLVGNHGPKALKELAKMAAVHNQFGKWVTLADGTKRFRPPSILYAEGLSDVDRKAVKAMSTLHGLSTDTLANEIFNNATRPIDKYDSKAVENAKDAAGLIISGGLMHHAERLARETLALPSFRMHLAEMEKANPNDPANFHKAVKAAIEETNEALGNYAPGNRQLFMRGPLGKFASIYKYFGYQRIKMLGANFFKMLPGLNAEGKTAAATKFFGILGMHTMLYGVAAGIPFMLPLSSAINSLWNQWQNDKDVPKTMKDLDFDTWWRTEWIPNELGEGRINKLTADVLKGGVMNTATGWDFANRFGLKDLLMRDPAPGKNSSEDIVNYVNAFVGAGLSPITEALRSYNLFNQGEYQKAFEAFPLTPKSVSAASTANRLATEGIETAKGVPLIAKGEAKPSEIAGQVIGFRPARLVEAQGIAHATDVVQKQINLQKQDITRGMINSMVRSVDQNKSEKDRARFRDLFQEHLKRAMKFDRQYPSEAIKDNISDQIDKALEEIQLERAFGGVKITDQNAPLFIKAARETMRTLHLKE